MGVESVGQRLTEIDQALTAEIDSLKKGRGGRIRLLDGRYLRQVGEQHFYLFHLENFTSSIDDAPGQVKIDGRDYPCQIVTVQGLEVEIALEENLGPVVGEATLANDTWRLLELLRDKFQKTGPDSSRFALSQALFNGETGGLESDAAGPTYTLVPAPPNESQQQAIAASFGRSLSVIWGPPGTGKTKTIAKAVEAHLNAGRRVLLVSHANTAVDEALEDIAEQLRPTHFYQDGRLVRFGVCQKKTLEEQYPLVLPEKIVAMRGQALRLEQAELQAEAQRITGELGRLDALGRLEQQLQQANRDADNLAQAAGDLAKRAEKAREEIRTTEQRLARSRERLVEAEHSGFVKRLFKGLDPKRLQREIGELATTLESHRRVLSETETVYQNAELARTQKASEIQSLRGQLVDGLARLGVQAGAFRAETETRRARLKTIEARVAEIREALEKLLQDVLGGACLVGTTLTRTFSSRQLPETPFDVLVVDESSMAPLPLLYWAVGRATKAVTVVGDFLQLPPICTTEDPAAKKWLARSIFDVLGINTVDAATTDERVTLLDMQYRMAPPISAAPNRLFYNGLLTDAPDTEKLRLHEPVGKDSPLVLVDTSEMNPVCQRAPGGGRFSVYSALVCATLAKRLADDVPDTTVGITTPYKHQARLIARMATDLGVRNRVRASNIHTFQGGEEGIIILDCVESFPGSFGGRGYWSMLDEILSYPGARNLINVALTRAKAKVFLVANVAFLRRHHPRNAVLHEILDHFGENGRIVPSSPLVPQYVAEPQAEPPAEKPQLHTEQDFWPAFCADLRSALQRVTIMSAFLTRSRLANLQHYFVALTKRGVKLTVYTKPAHEHKEDHMRKQAADVIGRLGGLGVQVMTRGDMHHKVAIIDDRIAWEGSLNILSYSNTHEHMRRFVGSQTVLEIGRVLELNLEGVAEGGVCPECGEGELARKKGRRGPFLGCSRYPACRYTHNVPE